MLWHMAGCHGHGADASGGELGSRDGLAIPATFVQAEPSRHGLPHDVWTKPTGGLPAARGAEGKRFC
jgi:hypothetical protein